MERDDFRCQNCGNPDTTLNIHHKYYIKDRDPWEYPDLSLITLCDYCHAKEHTSKTEIEKDLLISLYDIGFTTDDISEISAGFKKFKLMETSIWVAMALSKWLSNKKNQKELIGWAFPNKKLKKENKNGKTK